MALCWGNEIRRKDALSEKEARYEKNCLSSQKLLKQANDRLLMVETTEERSKSSRDNDPGVQTRGYSRGQR